MFCLHHMLEAHNTTHGRSCIQAVKTILCHFLLCIDATAFSRAHFGQGSGAILLDNVACTGLEERLVNCSYDRHTADCYHYQDAGVRCSTATCKIMCYTHTQLYQNAQCDM